MGALRRGETTHLKLRCAEIGVMDIYVLAGLLKHYNHAMTEIDLSSNRICGVHVDNHGVMIGKRDHVGLRALIDALHDSTCLKGLHLSSARPNPTFSYEIQSRGGERRNDMGDHDTRSAKRETRKHTLIEEKNDSPSRLPLSNLQSSFDTAGTTTVRVRASLSLSLARSLHDAGRGPPWVCCRQCVGRRGLRGAVHAASRHGAEANADESLRD